MKIFPILAVIAAALLSSCQHAEESPQLQEDRQQLLGSGGQVDRGQRNPNTP